MTTLRIAAVVALVSALTACAAGPRDAGAGGPAGGAISADYWAYVAAESADRLHRVRIGPDGAEVERTFPVGRYPTENEGPHGLAISADGRHLYLTTGHGVPTGMLWKYELGPDTLLGSEVALGNFPATVDVTPDGLFAFVVNFNLHGDHVPSDVSVVYTPDMIEVARTGTCTMPHGSRINPAGTRHYSACMMDDRLVEIDTRTFRVARVFGVGTGAEGPVSPADHHVAHGADATGDDSPDRAAAHGPSPAATPTCSPTWAEPSADGSKVYVACNRADRILEIDVERWELGRTFPTGRGPYNLEATPDGRLLLVTLKAGAAVQFLDLETGEILATTPSTTTVTHGVVASPDSRIAFVSVEGVGAEPGKVDILDLRSFERIASLEVGQQAGGLAFWKMELR